MHQVETIQKFKIPFFSFQKRYVEHDTGRSQLSRTISAPFSGNKRRKKKGLRRDSQQNAIKNVTKQKSLIKKQKELINQTSRKRGKR